MGQNLDTRTPMQVGLDMAESAFLTVMDGFSDGAWVDPWGGEWTSPVECLDSLSLNIDDTLLELGCAHNGPEMEAANKRLDELTAAEPSLAGNKWWGPDAT